MSINDNVFNEVIPQAQRDMLRGSMTFDAVRALYAMTKGRLRVNFIEGSTCVMGTSYGYNVAHVSVREHKGDQCYALYGVASNWAPLRSHTEIVITKKIPYLKRRFKMTSEYDRAVTDDMHGYVSDVGVKRRLGWSLRGLCDNYISKLSSSANVDLNARVSFSSKIDEWMLRYFMGMTARSEIPNDVIYTVEQEAKRYQGKADFLRQAEDLVKSMFDREKWVLIPQLGGITVIGLDTRALVPYVVQGMVNGNSLSDDVENCFAITYQPRFVRSIDEIGDDAVRSSILSSLALVKASRAALYPSTPLRDPNGYFTKNPLFQMSNEAGWMEHLESWSGQYANHFLMIDKD